MCVHALLFAWLDDWLLGVSNFLCVCVHTRTCCHDGGWYVVMKVVCWFLEPLLVEFGVLVGGLGACWADC